MKRWKSTDICGVGVGWWQKCSEAPLAQKLIIGQHYSTAKSYLNMVAALYGKKTYYF